jgi:hypothetical protein
LLARDEVPMRLACVHSFGVAAARIHGCHWAVMEESGERPGPRAGPIWNLHGELHMTVCSATMCIRRDREKTQVPRKMAGYGWSRWGIVRNEAWLIKRAKDELCDLIEQSHEP